MYLRVEEKRTWLYDYDKHNMFAPNFGDGVVTVVFVGRFSRIYISVES